MDHLINIKTNVYGTIIIQRVDGVSFRITDKEAASLMIQLSRTLHTTFCTRDPCTCGVGLNPQGCDTQAISTRTPQHNV